MKQGGGEDLRQGGVFQFHNLVTADQEVRSIRAMREVRRIKAMREEETEEGRDECVHYNVVTADKGGAKYPFKSSSVADRRYASMPAKEARAPRGADLGEEEEQREASVSYSTTARNRNRHS